MASKNERAQTGKTPSKQGDGDPGTRSGQPNPENVPSHPTQHKSGYGGEGGAPRTSSDKRETPKKG
ncbi:MAG: hypothetical protein M3365_12485 [Gemmatimonadota bacterium]|nr:hypothetical protein [Gemmatimonadota bacterium]